MMKKLIQTTIFAIVFLLPRVLCAHVFEVDGIYFNINDDRESVSVTYKDNSFCSYTNKIIAIPTSVAYGGITYPVTSIGRNAFSQCKEVQRIELPNSVTCIGYSAFAECSMLQSVVLPTSLTSIEDFSFYNCFNLQSIEFPNSLASIGVDAFYKCSSLQSIEIPNFVRHVGAYAFSACTGLQNVKLSNSITSLGDYVFCYCSSLQSIEIPGSVKTIGVAPFEGCTSLKNIDVDSRNGYFTSRDGVLFNKQMTYLICYPIGKKENKYTIPNSVSSIGTAAFCLCANLQDIEIPSSVTCIENYAFWFCSNLKSIACYAEEPPSTLEDIFTDEIYSDAVLYVPSEFMSEYKTSDYNWCNFRNICPISDYDGISIPGKANESQEPVTIYHLNGMRINDAESNLTHGTYIIKQGERVRKVIVL